MVCHLEFLDAAGELVSHCVDCIPVASSIGEVPHESKNYEFVRDSMWQLFNAGFFQGLHRIYWWSDTGPNHFRVSNTLYALREFQEQTKLEIIINFFAPYHGHSVCDGHIGTVARMLRKEARKLAGSTEFWDAAWVCRKLSSGILNATTVLRVYIRRGVPIVCSLPGIKKYLTFTFDSSQPNTVSASVNASGSATVLQFQPLRPDEALQQQNADAAEDARLQSLLETD